MTQRSGSVVQTFLFADLSGFTALTEAHGDEHAVDLVTGFCITVRRLLAEHPAHEVKTIGDALMLRAGDAAAAIQLGLCVVHDVGAQHGFPLVRVGMHTGPAVERDGDWFGATVNLAARVSAAVPGGEVLLTAVTRDVAGQLEGVELRERGRWAFRNVAEPVPVFAAVRQGARSSSGLPIDPPSPSTQPGTRQLNANRESSCPVPASCQHTSLPMPCVAVRRFDPSLPTSWDDVRRIMVVASGAWGSHSLHTAEATGSKPVTPTIVSAAEPLKLAAHRRKGGDGRTARRGIGSAATRRPRGRIPLLCNVWLHRVEQVGEDAGWRWRLPPTLRGPPWPPRILRRAPHPELLNMTRRIRAGSRF
jgi:adenylate cyclase